MNYAPPGETSLDPLYQSLASIDASFCLVKTAQTKCVADRPVLDFPDALTRLKGLASGACGKK